MTESVRTRPQHDTDTSHACLEASGSPLPAIALGLLAFLGLAIASEPDSKAVPSWSGAKTLERYEVNGVKYRISREAAIYGFRPYTIYFYINEASSGITKTQRKLHNNYCLYIDTEGDNFVIGYNSVDRIEVPKPSSRQEVINEIRNNLSKIFPNGDKDDFEAIMPAIEKAISEFSRLNLD